MLKILVDCSESLMDSWFKVFWSRSMSVKHFKIALHKSSPRVLSLKESRANSSPRRNVSNRYCIFLMKYRKQFHIANLLTFFDQFFVVWIVPSQMEIFITFFIILTLFLKRWKRWSANDDKQQNQLR